MKAGLFSCLAGGLFGLFGASSAVGATLNYYGSGTYFMAPPPGAINPALTSDGSGVNLTYDGFTYQSSAVYAEAPIGLTDDAGIVTATLRMVSGGRFSLSAFDMRGWNYSAYVTGSGPAPTDPTLFDAWMFDHLSTEMGWKVEGYRGGKLVSSFSQPVPQSLNFATLTFGNLFQNLDYLVFSMIFPTGVVYYEYGDQNTPAPGGTWCEPFYCGQVEFTNIQVAAVPLPAGLPMVLTGIGALYLVRRKRGAA